MPLKLQVRLFFLNGKIRKIFNYRDEGNYNNSQPDQEKFEFIGKSIKSNFFTMAIAKRNDGDWIIMESGDGQVSGLPDNSDKIYFYK
jgi:hypothetical protein